MSPKLKNLNADNFYQHLRQASRLLKSALNREALDKLKPYPILTLFILVFFEIQL